ncbi:S-adenosyl-L-methionine-dependent methyltransferase [Aspergillus stella-maris]|uniref:S-adenosyl-L-methionine-dependent methyltransferase n=1 Tax=Aspergillus stella-maris TaxID=1810926 RepID=UPI003CCD15BB
MEQREQPASSTVAILNAIQLEDFTSNVDRHKTLVAASALISRLETPLETTERLCMHEPALGACLKIAKDLDLWGKWHEHGDEPLDSSSLAAMVGCQPDLLVRVLRHLAANHVLEQVSGDTFKPTRFWRALSQPAVGECINFLYDLSIPTFFKAPSFLQSTSYANPTDAKAGIFQAAKANFPGDLYAYLAEHPREGASFNSIMTGVAETLPSWTDMLPVQERILQGADTDPTSPLIVDIGGNVGHDTERFRQAYPDLASRLYLQDRENVVSRATCADAVNKVAHDFFTPQPISGARVYYLHSILHNWTDESCKLILEMVKGAMKRGYSKLLIHEHVVPETGLHPHTTSFDLIMMALFGAKERTEPEWRALLESAGFKIVNIWTSELAVQAVIEAELA